MNETVAGVLEALAPEPEFLLEHPNGFSWWPHGRAQHVVARAAGAARDGATRVIVRHELVRDVPGSAEAFAVIADWNARHPGLSALAWDGVEESVALVALADVRDGDALATRRLASAALLQLGDVARDGDAIVEALGGTSADSAPPGSTARTEPDALTEAWQRFAEGGATAPASLRTALERAAAMTPPPWLRVRTDADGLHAELPCPAPDAGEASAPGKAATLHLVTTQPHPYLGAGLLAVMRPPIDFEPLMERRVSTAALLAAAEAREATGFDAFGAWCVHPSAGLAHVAFHPALVADDELPSRLAWEAGLRARWARAFLARVAALRPGA